MLLIPWVSVKGRASQVPKIAFHPNTDPNNTEIPTQGIPYPDYHSSAPSCCALGKRTGGAEKQKVGMFLISVSLPRQKVRDQVQFPST